MPSLTVKLYSLIYKFILKRQLQLLSSPPPPSPLKPTDHHQNAVVSRSDESFAPANPTFSNSDGVATKDIHIDPLSPLSLRIFLPDTVLVRGSRTDQNGLLVGPRFDQKVQNGVLVGPRFDQDDKNSVLVGPRFDKDDKNSALVGPRFDKNDRNGVLVGPRFDKDDHNGIMVGPRFDKNDQNGIMVGSRFDQNVKNGVLVGPRFDQNVKNGVLVGSRFDQNDKNGVMVGPRFDQNDKNGVMVGPRFDQDGVYGGYSPLFDTKDKNLVKKDKILRKLPVIVQFHGGGFVTGSGVSVGNDMFCRRVAKGCDAIVVAVGYRLAPESRYPGAFEDGVEALRWLAKQANLAECRGVGRVGTGRREIVDGFGMEMVEPWIAAHADLSRCVLLGSSSGSNIANYVTQKAVEAGKDLDPIKVVAQVLMYPFVIGNTPTKSEIKLANSYLYDRTMAISAWKLFLPHDQFNLDHPAANPLMTRIPLKQMPPTLTIVAEHDFMRDRAIAYSQELRKVNVDAPVYDYKDAVHEFATFEMFLNTPKAQACVEDIAIWMKKYISLRGQEFSY